MEWLDALKGFLSNVGEDAASMFDTSSSMSGPSLDIGNVDSLSDFMGSYGKRGGITRNITAPAVSANDFWKQSPDEYKKSLESQPVTGRFDLTAEGEDTPVKNLFGDSDYDKLKMWGLVSDKVSDLVSYPTKATAAIGDIEARGLQGLRPGSALDVIKETSSPSYAADLAELAADKIRRDEKKEWKELLTKAMGGEDDIPEYGGSDDVNFSMDIARSIASMSKEELMPILEEVMNEGKHGHMTPEKQEVLDSLIDHGGTKVQPKEELEKQNVYETLEKQDTFNTVKNINELIDWGGNRPALTERTIEETEDDVREALDRARRTRNQIKQDIRVTSPDVKVTTPSNKLAEVAAAISVSDKLDFFDDLEKDKKQKELEAQMNALREQQEGREDAEWMRLQQERMKDLSVAPAQITPIRWR